MDVTDILSSYGISAKVIDKITGPNVVRYVCSVPCGTRIGSVLGIERELSMYLESQVNIVAPIPGTKFVGIDVRREKCDLIKFKPRSDGQIYLGKDVYGSDVIMNLRKAPHILVAGTTGSGKSVCLNSMICCELMSGSELYLLDPKRVEFRVYEGLIDVDVVCDVGSMCKVLRDVVDRMEYRYGILEKYSYRNINEYNAMNTVPMTNIVVMIDEYADLLMESREYEYSEGKYRKISGKRVSSGWTRCSDVIEGSIVRLVQKARACGISVVIATQRPDAKVLTGIIRANVVSRIGLRVANSVESRVIMGDSESRCEKLAGKGDMIWKNESGKNLRLLGCWVSSEDIVKCRKSSGREIGGMQI